MPQVTYDSPLIISAATIAAQDATRKTYTASVDVPAGKVAVGIVTPLASEGQTATITLDGDDQTFDTINSNTGNLDKPNGDALTYHESGANFDVATAGTCTLEIDLTGGTATLYGVIVRAADPSSGIVEDQGTGEHCGPLAAKLSNGDRITVHASMYDGVIYAVRNLDGNPVEIFPARTGEGGYNEHYHRGAAVVELPSGSLLLAEVGHNLSDIKVRKASADLQTLGTIRTLAGSTLTYVQSRIAGSVAWLQSRGTAGANTRAALLYELSNPETIDASPASSTVDVVAINGDDWWYPQVLDVLDDGAGTEVLAAVWATRNNADAINWDDIRAAFFDPAASKWWALDGLAAAQNAALGTAGTPRFSDAQAAGLTKDGAGITLVGGASGTTRYGLPAAAWEVTQWPSAGSAIKGRVLAPFVDSPGGSIDYSYPGGYATFVSADSTGLVASNPSALNFEYDQPFSVSLWVNFASLAANAGLVAKRQTTDQRGWAVIALSSSSRFQIHLRSDNSPQAEATVASTATISTGTWYHVVAVNGGTGLAADLKLYVDGVEGQSTSFDNLAAGTIQNTGDLTLGCIVAPGTSGANASMRSVTYHDVALTAAEVLAIYNQGFPRKYEDLPASIRSSVVAAHDLDETSAGSAPVSRADATGGGMTLTDNGTTVGTTVAGATLRWLIQDESTRRVSPTDFTGPTVEVSNSYRFAAASSQIAANVWRFAFTERGRPPIAEDATGEGVGLYWDWGATTLRVVDVDLTDWSAPVFSDVATVEPDDTLPVTQINAIGGEAGAFVYPRAVNEFAQAHRQGLVTTYGAAASGGLRAKLKRWGMLKAVPPRWWMTRGR